MEGGFHRLPFVVAMYFLHAVYRYVYICCMEKSERHKMYQRARSWKARPTKFITSRFSEDGKNELRRVEVLRRVDRGMRKWISDEDVMTEMLALAKRNGWIA